MPDATPVERWLPVVDWEDRYTVSDLGNVRSIYRARNKKLSLSKTGYLYVGLSKGDITRCKWVHTLVIQAFIGPPPPGLECLHGPGGKQDNRLTNLSYGTHSKNLYDMRRDGTSYHRNLTHCPYGHILAMPNLVKKLWEEKGHRNCLTCRLVGDNARYARRVGKPFDYEAELALRYSKIMGFSETSAKR